MTIATFPQVISAFEEPVINQQHYRMTLADAIEEYQLHLISASALVYYYIRIKRAEGWKITLNEETVCKELGIKRSTFYKAIAKLLEKKLIKTEKSKIVITVLELSPQIVDPSPQIVDPSPQIVDSSPQIVDSSLQIVDSSLQIVDSSPQIVDSSLQIVDNRRLEPLHQKGSSVSTNLYQIFSNSLSNSERESFLNFGKKKAAQLPNPPGLPQRWIEKNFEELSAEWYKSSNQTPPAENLKWETDPRTRDWLVIIEETANPLAFATDKEKQDFIRWCNETKQFSWLRVES